MLPKTIETPTEQNSKFCYIADTKYYTVNHAVITFPIERCNLRDVLMSE